MIKGKIDERDRREREHLQRRYASSLTIFSTNKIHKTSAKILKNFGD